MLYFLLYQNNIKISENNLKLVIRNTEQVFDPILSFSIRNYLNNSKKLICDYSQQWDTFKKYTNPYEFIHTTIPNYNVSISKIKPVSRSYFKMIEICRTFNLLYNEYKYINTFHLAEGPGGFIEAMAHLRNNKNDTYYGMTLIDNSNHSIPGWKKIDNFIKKYPNVVLETGDTGNGDLFDEKNFIYCKNKYGNTMHLVTADGGFDFSANYNEQENLAFRLIFTQIAYALILQKYNGTFILKIYDVFHRTTVEMLYFLNSFYKQVYITKPNTSRYANSEKYIVCKFFKFNNIEHISKKIFNILKLLNNIDFNKYNIHSMLDINLSLYHNTQLEEINSILGKQQIENILNTIKLISYKERKSDKLENIKTQNIQKCINWCINNNVPYNNNLETTNIFLNRRNH
tara:strand:- start:219 stop:1421 length:1203 start_codon:yes stop_codon:yes gene_type:complete